MKILFLTDNFPPEVNAPATRTFEHCREWVKNGADVTVITCAPNFPDGKVFEGYRNRLYNLEVMDGINVIRVWSYMAPNAGFLKRTLDYVSYAVSATLAGLFQKTDIIVATSPQFFTALAGYILSVLKRRPWIFELRDLWPESIAAVGAMKSGSVLRALEHLELFLYERANHIVSVTASFKEKLVARGVDGSKITVITNGAQLDDLNGSNVLPDLKSKWGLSDRLIVGYLGTHGLAHGLDFIIRAADLCADLPVTFVFVGKGAEKTRLEELASQKALSNVVFQDAVPRDLVSAHWAAFDVALIPLKKSPTFETVIPSKIFEAAGMGVPILLGVTGEAEEIVRRYDAGLSYEPEETKSFLQQLGRLVDDESLRIRLGENGQALAKDYDRVTLALRMLALICQTAQAKSRGKRPGAMP